MVYSIATQFTPGSGSFLSSFGAMFRISAVKNLSISTLDVHVNTTNEIKCQVWTKKGTFLLDDNDTMSSSLSDEWNIVFNASVIGKGIGEPTMLPLNLFNPVSITGGEEEFGQSFFISLDSPILINLDFDDISTDETVFQHNSHMNIFPGVATKETSFTSDIVRDIVWSGEIWYSLEENVSNESEEEIREVKTNFQGNSSSYGAFFDIYAFHDMKILSLDFHTQVLNKTMEVQVWTKQGSYHRQNDRDKNNWVQVVNTNVTGMGRFISTSIPSEAFIPINITASSTQSFYISTSSPSNSILCSKVKQLPNERYASNDDIWIFVGGGNENHQIDLKDYYSKDLKESKGWNGILRYKLVKLDLKSFASLPSAKTLNSSTYEPYHSDATYSPSDSYNQAEENVDMKATQFSYFVLAQHAVGTVFSSEIHVSQAKEKWISFVDTLSSFYGVNVKFSDLVLSYEYSLGKESHWCKEDEDNTCILLDLMLVLHTPKLSSAITRENLIKQAKAITANLDNLEDSLLECIGPDSFKLEMPFSISGAFYDEDLTFEEQQLIEVSMLDHLSNSFNECDCGISVKNVTITDYFFDVEVESRKLVRKRGESNINFALISFSSEVSGELYSSLSNTSVEILSENLTELVKQTLISVETKFVEDLSESEKFQYAEKILYLPANEGDDSIQSITDDGFEHFPYVIAVLALLLLIIPFIVIIELKRKRRKETFDSKKQISEKKKNSVRRNSSNIQPRSLERLSSRNKEDDIQIYCESDPSSRRNSATSIVDDNSGVAVRRQSLGNSMNGRTARRNSFISMKRRDSLKLSNAQNNEEAALQGGMRIGPIRRCSNIELNADTDELQSSRSSFTSLIGRSFSRRNSNSSMKSKSDSNLIRLDSADSLKQGDDTAPVLRMSSVASDISNARDLPTLEPSFSFKRRRSLPGVPFEPFNFDEVDFSKKPSPNTSQRPSRRASLSNIQMLSCKSLQKQGVRRLSMTLPFPKAANNSSTAPTRENSIESCRSQEVRSSRRRRSLPNIPSQNLEEVQNVDQLILKLQSDRRPSLADMRCDMVRAMWELEEKKKKGTSSTIHSRNSSICSYGYDNLIASRFSSMGSLHEIETGKNSISASQNESFPISRKNSFGSSKVQSTNASFNKFDSPVVALRRDSFGTSKVVPQNNSTLASRRDSFGSSGGVPQYNSNPATRRDSFGSNRFSRNNTIPASRRDSFGSNTGTPRNNSITASRRDSFGSNIAIPRNNSIPVSKRDSFDSRRGVHQTQGPTSNQNESFTFTTGQNVARTNSSRVSISLTRSVNREGSNKRRSMPMFLKEGSDVNCEISSFHKDIMRVRSSMKNSSNN